MRFDYLLGRQNCQQFLRATFVLGESNPLFTNWNADDKSKFRGRAGAGLLPIIPLVDEATVDETLDPWPKGKLDPERYRNAIEARFRAIFELELSGGFIKSILSWVACLLTGDRRTRQLAWHGMPSTCSGRTPMSRSPSRPVHRTPSPLLR